MLVRTTSSSGSPGDLPDNPPQPGDADTMTGATAATGFTVPSVGNDAGVVFGAVMRGRLIARNEDDRLELSRK